MQCHVNCKQPVEQHHPQVQRLVGSRVSTQAHIHSQHTEHFKSRPITAPDMATNQGLQAVQLQPCAAVSSNMSAVNQY